MSSQHPRWPGAVAGAAAGASALGVGELVAGFGEDLASPVVALADAVIRYLPPGVKQPAIELLGQADKPAMISTIVVVTLGLTAALGIRARRHLRAGIVGFAVLAVLAALAAFDTPQFGVLGTIPPLVAGLVGAGVLAWLIGRAGPHPAAAGTMDDARPVDDVWAGDDRPTDAWSTPSPRSRRGFLKAAGGVAGFGIAAGLAGRWLQQRVTVAAQRTALRIPGATDRRDLPVPPRAHPDVEGLPPAITPNDEFYRIDTAFSVPQIDPTTHQVRVTGMVERQLTIPFHELIQRSMIELPVMLSCVSNEVGGGLVDTAVWQGVLLRDVLDEAGVDDGADQIVGRSVDGWTCGFPVAAAYDRPALLAVKMNGEPLPPEHGFPVRLVTPGLYGYVSATKWLSELELTRFDEFSHYWAKRGWAEEAPIKTQSRIDVPQRDSTVASGTVPVAGVAWAPTEGVGKVEVRIDDGPWEPAELAAPINAISWRQWVYRWDAQPGQHFIAVRATEEGGETQPEERVPPKPDGATGWHTISVTVGEG